MRLIDADALEREGWSLCRTFQKDKDTMVYEVKKPSNFLTIEPERKKGKWIHGKELSRVYIGDACVGINYEDFHCSVCNVVVEEPCKPTWNYCPNCGAEMSE